MILKYGAEIDKSAIDKNLNRITNQIYKLLPSREEKSDWQKPLATIIEELAGMDFFLYRRTIFECLGLINNIKI